MSARRGGARALVGGGDQPSRPLRLFVGARVSLTTVRALEDAVDSLRAGAVERGHAAGLRWVAPASYHVTLKFLGWTRPEVVTALGDRVGAALGGARAFELETRGLGAFPSGHKARVVWAGIDAHGGERLAELAQRVEDACAELGFGREKRAFHPHVTLARLKVPGDVSELLESQSEQTYRFSVIDHLVLYESTMKSTGSEYSPLLTWPLEQASKPRRRHTGPVEPAVNELAVGPGEPGTSNRSSHELGSEENADGDQ